MDRHVMHLAVLAVHSALPTLKIDGVIAGIEDRRRADRTADEGRSHEFEAMALMAGHRNSPRLYTRERYRTLSRRRLAIDAAGGEPRCNNSACESGQN